jgi:trans-AT polyketide synthase/acyltransferase/oxidoreductase domain-containing protein
MTVRHDPDEVYAVLAALDRPCYIVRADGRIGACGEPPRPGSGATLLTATGPMPIARLGSSGFLRHHGVQYPYMTGAMARGIASEELVIAVARAGCLASFGAAGLSPDRIERALLRLTRDIPGLPFAANLIHSPHAPHLERTTVDLYLRHQVRCVEASAFVQLTPDVVRYRLAGLRRDPTAGVRAENRLIAKVSRAEVAELFLRPAPDTVVGELLARGLVTAEQADLARLVPMADDLTVEADSAGHTDRQPLVTALPSMLDLRDRIARDCGYPVPVRVGAAGGVGTPQAALAAFSLGAAYIVTGSVNQSCLEAGTSPEVKALLAAAGHADYAMAPAADMFEAGAEVQVLRRGTLFPGRARRLTELYRAYRSLDDLSAADRGRLEQQIFQRSVAEVWQETAEYLARHHPDQLARAAREPRHRMALTFRWYLGQSSQWAARGEQGRSSDFQVWCGPAMGAFNGWVAGTRLMDPAHRLVADVAHHLLRGAAFSSRVAQLRFSGVTIPSACAHYRLPATAPDPAGAAVA